MHHACLGTCTWAGLHRNTMRCNDVHAALSLERPSLSPERPPRRTTEADGAFFFARNSSYSIAPCNQPCISARCVPRRSAWAAAIYAKALLLCPVVTCMRSSASSSASSSSSPTRLSTSRRNIACAVCYAAADARHVTARKIRLAFYCVCIPGYKQNRQCTRCVHKGLHLCKQNEQNNQGSVQK